MARSPLSRKLLMATLATLVCLLLAEGTLRVMVATEQPPLGRISYQTADGEAVSDLAAAVKRGFIVMVDAKCPRPRGMFRPGLDFFLCYTDAAKLARPWFDAQGRVPVHIDQFGIRDRDDLTREKPAGQRRVVCLGDSFTFGWGVRDEDGWVRQLETDLRSSGHDIRTVNCGAAGALCVDEYAAGLQHRFGAFEPDVVLVTLCLNDLIPSSGLCFVDPVPQTGIRLVDLVRRTFGRSPLDLDPQRDWVGELLALPLEEGTKAGYYGTNSPFEAMWSQGVPQKSLREMRAWCEARKATLLVVLWPFLQGLGPGRTYPFRRLHELVEADCKAAGIPFHDVLPALQQTPQEDLWVTPADMHANPTAHRLAAPGIAQFVRQHWQP